MKSFNVLMKNLIRVLNVKKIEDYIIYMIYLAWLQYIFRMIFWCWVSLPHLNWIGALTSLLLKLPPRKLEPWFVLWSFFLLRLLCISTNLPYSHAWNTLGSLLKCRQLKSFLQVLLWYIFIWTGLTGSTSLFLRVVYSLF